MKSCICKYPRSGIGNKLLVLLRAYNVSKILSIPIYETSFSQIPLFSSFRNKVGKRVYLKNKLRKSRNYITLIQRIKCLLGNFYEVNSLKNLNTRKNLLLVKDFPSYPNKNPFLEFILFYDDSRNYLRKRIDFSFTKNKILKVALHIRRGDFNKENYQGRFLNNTRTKIDYFLKIIKDLDNYFKKRSIESEFTIYTDQLDCVAKEIKTNFKNFSIISNDPFDDFYGICNSDIIVVSPWSTFSGLAAILGEPIIVVYPKELHYQFTDLPIKFKVIDPNRIASDLDINQ